MIRRSIAPGALAALAVLACGGWSVETARPSTEPDAGEGGAGAAEGGASSGGTSAGGTSAGTSSVDYPRGFRVVENRIEDAEGNRVFLRGVNRSGSEYRCVQGAGFFDGPDDEASIAAIRTWGLNAVRVPLNESCWLGINGSPARFSGQRYRDAIVAYVERLHARGLVPILDLHWAAPGERLAVDLTPMPNLDHSVDFWRSVAETFLDDDGVIFEPFNEPFPDQNQDTPEGWACWRDGCEIVERGTTETYTAVGMQSLVTAIRETGSRHLLLLGGLQYSNALGGWLEHRPNDPEENLAAAWHVYNFNLCNSSGCWNEVPASLANAVPIVATEIGQNDCLGASFLKPLLEFLDAHGSGYLAWSWNAYGECVPAVPRMTQGAPWSLITDYVVAEPNSDYARTFYDHVREVGR